MANRYWVWWWATTNWTQSWTTNWGTASATTDNASVPGASDDVIFDSWFSGNCVFDKSGSECKSITFTWWTWYTWTFNISNANVLVYWWITLSTTTTYSGSWNFVMRATSWTNVYDTKWITLPSYWLIISGSWWTHKLWNDLIMWWTTARSLQLIAGTFDWDWKTVKFAANTSNPCSISWDFWTANCNIWCDTSWTWELYVTWTSTFLNFKISAWRTVRFTSGKTTTVGTFTAIWTSWSPITIYTSTTTNATLTKAWWWVISCDYIDIDYITGSPDDTWYMWNNSTDWWHNSKIYFTEPPATTNTTNFFMFF